MNKANGDPLLPGEDDPIILKRREQLAYNAQKRSLLKSGEMADLSKIQTKYKMFNEVHILEPIALQQKC